MNDHLPDSVPALQRALVKARERLAAARFRLRADRASIVGLLLAEARMFREENIQVLNAPADQRQKFNAAVALVLEDVARRVARGADLPSPLWPKRA